MNSSLLIQQCPAYLVRLILIVFVMVVDVRTAAAFGVLLPGLVRYCSKPSCVVAVKLFLHPFN